MKAREVVKKVMGTAVVFTMAAALLGCTAKPVTEKETESAAKTVTEGQGDTPSETKTDAKEETKEETKKETGEGYKVGISILDSSNTLYVDVIEGVKSCFGDGDTVTIVDCNNNAATQAEQIENLANAGYDGIIVLPADAAAVSPAAKEAMEKETRILTFVTKLEEQDSHINSDSYVYGSMLGEALGNWVNEYFPDEEQVEVGMLTYNSIPECITRQQGMKEAMEEIAPNAVIVAELDAGSPEEGLTAAENFLQAHPNMKAIYGINDGGAVGAYQAVIGSGKDTTNFFIGGTDGIREALDLIADDTIYRCTVSINPFDIGERCAKNLINMVDGNEYWEEGWYDLQLVTPDNVSQFLK